MEQQLFDQSGEELKRAPEFKEKKPVRFGLLIVVVAILVVAVGIGAYWCKTEPKPEAMPSVNIAKPAEQNNKVISLKEINQDLGLFKVTQNDTSNNYTPTYNYYDAGVVDSGQYSGYHRILGFRSADDPSGGTTAIFATNDNKTYLADKDSISYPLDPSLALTSADSEFNGQKVVGFADLNIKQPETVALGDFVLVRQPIDLIGVLADDVELKSDVPGIRFFYESKNGFSIQGFAITGQPANAGEKTMQSAQNDLAGNTYVLAQDSSGLTFRYLLTSRESYDRVKASDKTFYNYSDFILSSEVVSSLPLYKSYGQLLPGGCGATDATYLVKNISDVDVVKIGTTKNGMDLYAPKDKNYILNQAEYYDKVVQFFSDQYNYFKEMNNIAAPGYDDYVSRYPVVLLKDPWNRWLALGEVEYLIPGGCGKPVIYLYPQKPTEVKISFIRPIDFSDVIPNYASGWDVMAYPGGKLKDLQPGLTDCNKINDKESGSEYAKSACLANDYPYLYWSGQSFGATYDKLSEGWVVGKNDLGNFLSAKLSELGLTDKERADMMSYWVPELQNKNAPYYRLSFLQTEEMNKLIPMKVVPAPDTTFRIFLDWEPLSSQPSQNIEPQTLYGIKRNGFTLVEWGGLKR